MVMLGTSAPVAELVTPIQELLHVAFMDLCSDDLHTFSQGFLPLAYTLLHVPNISYFASPQGLETVIKHNEFVE